MKLVISGLIALAFFAAAPVARAGENILQNGGAEEGDKSPKGWSQGAEISGVEYIWDKNAGQQGKASLCLEKTANRYFPIAQWYQVVNRTGDQPALQVSAQVKAKGVTKAIIDVAFLDEMGESVGHKWAAYIGAKEAGAAPANHDWKEYAGRVEIPPGTKRLQIGLQVYGPGKVWFDEVRAEYAK
jgi:RNA polymerase sigma-70 factor (ECF subfamily)